MKAAQAVVLAARLIIVHLLKFSDSTVTTATLWSNSHSFLVHAKYAVCPELVTAEYQHMLFWKREICICKSKYSKQTRNCFLQMFLNVKHIAQKV